MKDMNRPNLPVSHNYIKSKELALQIERNGYAIIRFLEHTSLTELRNLFDRNHKISQPGFFFSIFNNDAEYRKKMMEVSLSIIQPFLDIFFQDYKVGYSGFVIRGPLDKGELFIHQDPSFIDETKYSPLHLWCPLHDITPDFSPVCVIPGSHRLSSIYRANTIPAPFNSIRNLVRQYMQPLLPKSGEVILLDPRIIHNSLPNLTKVARASLLVQLFPKEANYFTPYLRGHSLELYSLPENYFVINSNFYTNVDEQPATGTLVKSFPFEPYQITEEDFLRFCVDNNLKLRNGSKENVVGAQAFVDIK